MCKRSSIEGHWPIRKHSPATENSLARAPENGPNILLECGEQRSHIKLNKNDRTALAEF